MGILSNQDGNARECWGTKAGTNTEMNNTTQFGKMTDKLTLFIEQAQWTPTAEHAKNFRDWLAWWEKRRPQMEMEESE